MNVAMLGSGAWGTAFAMVLGHAGSNVKIWSRDARVVEQITTIHQNRAYHPGVDLPETVGASLEIGETLDGADMVVLALPAQVVRDTLISHREYIPSGSVVISLVKGIELGTTMRMSQVVRESLGMSDSNIAVVSGPNLAREIVQRQPTATTVACSDPDVARRVQAVCTTNYFQIGRAHV